MKKKRSNLQEWLFIWSLGLAGQLCWNIENVWFNTFVYAKIAPNPSIITWMVAVSATVTTISTFLMGAWSDRLGRRKPFIGFGYIAWGIFTILFGLTQFANNSFVSIVFVVVAADAIMSFFGSVGNDSGFNSWTSDLLTDENRGQMGAAIAIHPVLGTIVGTLIGGIIIEKFDYLAFFMVMGILVMVIGLLSLFFLPETPRPKKNKEKFFKQFISAFDFKKLSKSKELLYVFITMAIFFIGFNIYYVHITNYFIEVLKYTESQAGLIQGGCLLVAILATIPAARYINKGKSSNLIKIALLIDLVGLGILYLVSESLPFLLVGVFLSGVAYVLLMQTLTVWTKRLYPEESRGQFEGVRIIFLVLLPMVIGPLIADPLIRNFGIEVIIDGVKGYYPTRILFLAGFIFAILTFIPLYFANKHHKINSKQLQEQSS